MVWTTVTYQTGELITEVQLNKLRDNLILLGTHDHSGGSGSGAALLGPLTAVTGSANLPAAPAANLVVLHSTGTTMAWRNSAGTFVGIHTSHTHAAI